MSQWGNTGYGQGYNQQQGQYSTDSQQVSQHLKHPSHTLPVLSCTSTAPRCHCPGSIRIRRQLRRDPTGEFCQHVKLQLRSSTDVFSVEMLLKPHKSGLVHSLQSGSTYGTGYQGASTQSTQQPQGYDASNSSYPAADQQQGYSAGQTDYTSSQQVLPHSAHSGQAMYFEISLRHDKYCTLDKKWVAVNFGKQNTGACLCTTFIGELVSNQNLLFVPASANS